MAVAYHHFVKPFDGTGFDAWRFRLEARLGREGCKEALSEKTTMTQYQYDLLDVKAQDIIVRSLSDSVIDTVRGKSTSKEMIEALKAVYTRKSRASRICLKRELTGMKFMKG